MLLAKLTTVSFWPAPAARLIVYSAVGTDPKRSFPGSCSSDSVNASLAPILIKWIPNAVRESDAEKRLRDHGPMPKEPMGEAWFMGESRTMYDELLGDLDYIATEQIQQILVEIASGTSCFGAMEEWTDWYHYLMPRLLDRSHENFVDYTLENLITCFVALHPDENDVSGAYSSFKKDALATLGNAMMEGIRWDGDRVNLDRALHSFGIAKTGYLMWQEVSGDLSASLFFRTKYLDPDDFDPWLASVLAIDCPHWRSQLIVWFADAYPVLSGEVRFISELDEDSAVDWAWSHVLDGQYPGSHENVRKVPFFADDSRPMKFETTKYRLHDIDLDSWLRSVGHIAYLRDAIERAADRFAHLYL